ncbi:MAG: helix-hairpin-helix domain-containing protein [bacterium]
MGKPGRIRRGARAAREPVEERLVALFGGSVHSPAPSDERRPVVWRVATERRSALAVLAAVVIAAAVIGWRVAADRPRSAGVPAVAISLPESAGASPPAGSVTNRTPANGATSAAEPGHTGSAGSASASVSRSGPLVIVDVVGRVRHPGLVRLPAGARVDDAVRAAGGALPGTDLASLNLARVLVDGEQIGVGRPAAAASGGAVPAGGSRAGVGASGGAASGGPVNLNTATLEQLDGLPGVGSVLAQHILDWRALHGRFDSIDQLDDVSGIGDAKFADLKPLVTV